MLLLKITSTDFGGTNMSSQIHVVIDLDSPVGTQNMPSRAVTPLVRIAKRKATPTGSLRAWIEISQCARGCLWSRA